MKKSNKFSIHYAPKSLSLKDQKKQIQMIKKSQKLYKKNIYYTRKPLASYKNKTSKHIINAQKIYKINKIIPNKQLSKATGCSISALKAIVKKGQGAYYSSGSRPNQTGQSWGLARLASSITGGKASVVDYNILQKGCDSKSKALNLATKMMHLKTKKSK